jgi:hypothetical protein
MTDVVTPGYRKLIASGAVINNSCSLTKYRFKAGVSNVTFPINPDLSRTYTGPLGSVLYWGFIAWDTPPSADIPDLKLQCIARMDKPDFDFGEDLGELGQTLKFIKNPIKALTDLSKGYKKLQAKKYRENMRKSGRVRDKSLPRAARRELSRSEAYAKASADAYATYQWAFQPLVRSAEDLTEALMQEQAGKPPPRFSARSRYRADATQSGVYDQADGIYSFSQTHGLDASASILYENKRTDNATLKKYGLRIKDSKRTAWQLVPLSFMIDRVSNISNAISAVSNLDDPGLRILAASVVTRRTTDRSMELSMAYHDTYQFTVGGEVTVESSFSYDREVWKPTSADAIPGFNPLGLVEDAKSIVDLVALTVQRLL